MKKLTLYFWNVLRWLDCGLNCLVLLGAYNETLSCRAAKARNNQRKWGCVLCKILDSINTNHCDTALKESIGMDAIVPDGE